MSEGKHPGGRPSTYKPEYCEQILEWFDREPFTMSVIEGTDKVIRVPAKLPSLTNFAMHIGASRSTLWEWAKQHAEFSNAIQKAKEIQEEILMQNGLFGAYEKTFAIFTAKNVCGWRDKQEVEHSGHIGRDMSDEELDAAIAKKQAELNGD